MNFADIHFFDSYALCGLYAYACEGRAFEWERVAPLIPATASHACDAKSVARSQVDLLDNVAFRRAFEKVLKDKRLSEALPGERVQFATAATQPEAHA